MGTSATPNVYEALLAAQRARAEQAQAEANEPGMLGTALDYLNRPYSAVVGSLKGIAEGEDWTRNAERALTGQEHYGAADLLVAAGANPDSTATKLGGLALDVFPGGFIDPLTPLTLGLNKVGKLAKIGGKLPTREMMTGHVAGIAEDVPDLVAAAKAGQWGPSYLGVSLAPRLVNEQLAKAVQGAGDYIKGRAPVAQELGAVKRATSAPYRTLRPLFGGKRKTYDQFFADLTEKKLALSEDGIAAVNQIKAIGASKSPETRELMTHFIEQPILMERALAGDQRIAYAVPKDMSEPEWRAFLDEMLPYAKAAQTPDEAYRDVALSVLPDLGRTLMNNPIRKFEAVRLSQFAKLFPGGTDAKEVTENILQAPELRELMAKELGADYTFEAILRADDDVKDPANALLRYLNQTKTAKGRQSTNGTPWLSADEVLQGKKKDPWILVSRPNPMDQIPLPQRKEFAQTLSIFEKLAKFSEQGGNLRDWQAVKGLSKSPKLKTIWEAMNDAVYERSAQDLGGKAWGKYSTLSKEWALLRAHGDKALEWQWKHATMEGLIGEKVDELNRLNLPTAPDAPFSIIDHERKAKLIEELDALRAEQRDPALFGRAAKLRETLDKAKRPATKLNANEERILELGAYSPEAVAAAAEAVEEIRPLLGQIGDMYKSRGVQFGRDQSTYVQHFLKGLVRQVYDAPLDAAKRIEKEGQFKSALMERMAMESPWLNAEEIARRVEIEVANNRSYFARKPVGTGKFDPLVHRREYDVPILVYNAIHPDKPFETDMAKIASEEYRVASNWSWGYDAYKHLIDKYAGKFARKITDPKQVPNGWVKIDYHVPGDPAKNPFNNWYAPKDLIESMKGGMKAVKEFSSDEGTQRLMEVLHGARRWWSAWTLGIFPAYHMRNLAGNVTLAQVAGVDLKTPLGMKAWAAGFGAISEARGEAALQGWADQLNAVYGVTEFSPDKLRRLMKAENIMGIGVRDFDWENHGDEINAILKESFDKESKKKKLLRWIHPDYRKNTAIKYGFDAARKIDDLGRATVFLHRLMTNSAATTDVTRAIREAVSHTKTNMYDYSDLTAFESNVMKLLVPFYTFTAKNTPHMIGEFIRQPGKFQYLNRAYHGAWSGYDEELEPEDLPDFMQKDLRVPIAKGKNGEYVMFTGRGWFPAAELMELAQMFTEKNGMAQYFISRVNPVFKTPLELAMNRNSFTGEEINEPGRVKDLWSVTAGPTWFRYSLENIRLLTEIDRLNPGGVFTTLGKMRGLWDDKRPHRNEAPGVYRALQSGLGLNFKDVDPVESLRKQISKVGKDINGLKSDVRYAVRTGQWAERDRKLEEINKLVEQQRALSERMAERQRYTAAHLSGV